MTPNDGSADGPTATDSATVVNSAPTLSVAFDDASPRSNAVLTATATAADADGDPVALTYVWKVNGGAAVKTTGPTATTTDTLDLAVAGHGDDGDSVTAAVTADDGTATTGPTTATANVGVDNLPTATVALDSATPKTNDVLTATATRHDDDGDPVTLTYVWKVNGATVKTTAGSSALTDTLDLSAAGAGDKGDTVTVDAIPHDGFGAGAAATGTAVVANSAPVVDAVAIDQAAPRTNDR